MCKCRYLELLWRWDVQGPWSWCGGWLCSPCRSSWLSTAGPGFFGGVLIAWDG